MNLIKYFLEIKTLSLIVKILKIQICTFDYIY